MCDTDNIRHSSGQTVSLMNKKNEQKKNANTKEKRAQNYKGSLDCLSFCFRSYCMYVCGAGACQQGFLDYCQQKINEIVENPFTSKRAIISLFLVLSSLHPQVWLRVCLCVCGSAFVGLARFPGATQKSSYMPTSQPASYTSRSPKVVYTHTDAPTK